MSFAARLIEKDIFASLIPAEAGDSEIIDLFGEDGNASCFSCLAYYDVSSPSAKTFASPHLASLVNQSLTYTSVDPGTTANSITIAITAPGSGTHALAISTVGSAISVSLETTAPVAATGTLDLTNDIVLTSVATGTARNTQTFTTQVLAAAANPTNTVLVAFSGTAAAIVCTVTPNDGTNNGAVPVDLTTAQLRELITTGAVVGKNITLTDGSSFRILQTATGGGAQNLADGGEGDGVVATFSGGANFNNAISTGNAVKAAINADPTASLLVLVSGSNASALTTLTATALSGGTDGVIDTTANTITITAHGFVTGLAVQASSTGTLPSPLLTATDYYVIVVDENTIKLATTLNNAIAGTAIDLTDKGSNNAVGTLTADALTGASVTFKGSNDPTYTSWVTLQTATTITVDGAVLYQQAVADFRYFKAVKALTSGVVDLKGYFLAIGNTI